MKLITVIDNFDLVHAQLDYSIELARQLNAELILYDLQQIPQLPFEPGLMYEDYADSQLDSQNLLLNARSNLKGIVKQIKKSNWNKTDFVLDARFFTQKQAYDEIRRHRLLELDANIILLQKPDQKGLPKFIEAYEMLALRAEVCPLILIPKNLSCEPWSRIYYTSRCVEFPNENMKFIVKLASIFASDVHIHYNSNLKKREAETVANSNEQHFRSTYSKGSTTFKLHRKTSCFEMIRMIGRRSPHDILVLEQDNPRYFTRMFRDWRVHKAFHENQSPIIFMTHHETTCTDNAD